MENAKDIITIVAALFGIYAAYNGIRVWRYQLKGTQEFETAKTILKQIIRLKYEFYRFRSPWKDISEITRAAKLNGIEISGINQVLEIDVDRLIYPQRWDSLMDVYRIIEEMKIDAEVLWGDKAKILFDELDKIIKSIYVNMDAYLRLRAEGGVRNENILPHKIVIEEESNEIDGDRFGRKIEKTLMNISEFLTKKIK